MHRGNPGKYFLHGWLGLEDVEPIRGPALWLARLLWLGFHWQHGVEEQAL